MGPTAGPGRGQERGFGPPGSLRRARGLPDAALQPDEGRQAVTLGSVKGGLVHLSSVEGGSCMPKRRTMLTLALGALVLNPDRRFWKRP